MKKWPSLVLQIGSPLLFLALFVAGWQLATSWWDIRPYLLPKPMAVAQAAWQQSRELMSASLITAAEAVCGFLMSLVVGTCAAFLLAQSRLFRSGLYPYAIFLQTVPMIAVAPLIVTWFGTGFLSVCLVSFIVSLFPVLANATSGLLSASPGLRELFQLYGASRFTRLFKLQLPSAVPAIITGARTASGAAVIGAIVGEFFAGYGSQHFGLGYYIRANSEMLKTDRLFAAVLACTAVGVVIFGAISWVGDWILRTWYDVTPDQTA